MSHVRIFVREKGSHIPITIYDACGDIDVVRLHAAVSLSIHHNCNRRLTGIRTFFQYCCAPLLRLAREVVHIETESSDGDPGGLCFHVAETPLHTHSQTHKRTKLSFMLHVHLLRGLFFNSSVVRQRLIVDKVNEKVNFLLMLSRM